MNWIDLNNIEQLEEIQQISNNTLVLIFKHSTRCSISSMAKRILERDWDENVKIKPYYLDLIKHREISNEIATKFDIFHQSPQAILIKNGESIYDASHSEISIKEMNSL